MVVVEDAVAVEDKLAEEVVVALGAVGEEAKREQYNCTTMKIIVTCMGTTFILSIPEQHATHRAQTINLQQPLRIIWADLSVIVISLYDRDHRIMIDITT